MAYYADDSDGGNSRFGRRVCGTWRTGDAGFFRVFAVEPVGGRAVHRGRREETGAPAQ